MPWLRSWDDNTFEENVFLSIASFVLILVAGMMSGLTLGLCSMDKTQLEVLKRSGTPLEQKCASKVAPLLENTHFLLVTLLLCNACAMEALPLLLDRLANPIMAIILSVTAVLFFGEIIPQSICTRYGLTIGARAAWMVRLLMFVCSPISWPISKLLDFVLGAEHLTLFRRKQLKALVDIHSEDKGMGGKLTRDETKIITGALDLTSKKAIRSMTPLDHVFMLSTEDRLDEPTLRKILNSGHSRIPVYRHPNKSDILGIILVKELLQYKMSEAVPVALLKMRSLPRLPASTPMYDMLKLFQTGRSHMAVLTKRRDEPQAAVHPASEQAPEDAKHDSQHEYDDYDEEIEAEEDPAGAEDGNGLVQHPHHDHESVEPIGIITIEDVIEELIRSEIVDETDIYVDNIHMVRVNQALLQQTLPDRLRAVLPSNLAAVIGAVRASAGGPRLGSHQEITSIAEEQLQAPLLPQRKQ